MGEQTTQASNLRYGSKIIFLGTGAQSIVLGKQIRASGGIIIQSGENQIHIDPGPGALVRAKEFGVNLRENTALLVSHNHIGHCNDVNAVIDAMTYSGLDRQGVLISNETLINGTEDIVPYLTKFHRNCLEKVMVLKEGQKAAIYDIEIKAIPVVHSESNAIGFRILTPEFDLVYTSDTDYSNKIIEAYQGCDILILNVVNPTEYKTTGNLCTEDAIKIIEKVKPRLSIITHFGVKMVEADPINEAREIQKQTKQQVIAAKDGMSINPATYAAKSQQKSLKSY